MATFLAVLVSLYSATTAAAWPNIDWVDITPDGDRNDRPSTDPVPDARGQDLDGDGVIGDFERDVDMDGVLDAYDSDQYRVYYFKRIPLHDYDGDAQYDDDPKDRVYGPEPTPDPDPDPAPDPDPDPEVVAQETTAAEETTQEETDREETTVSDAEEAASVGEDASSSWPIVLAMLLFGFIALVARWAERRPREETAAMASGPPTRPRASASEGEDAGTALGVRAPASGKAPKRERPPYKTLLNKYATRLDTLERYLLSKETSGKPLYVETMRKMDSDIESIRRDLDRLEVGSLGRSLGDLLKRRAELNERESRLRQRQLRIERK